MGLGSAQILYIEDDGQMRLALSEALEDQGYQVTCTEDGPTGLAVLRDGHFDLVLLDLCLPGMDGIAVCREIKRIARRELLPVVILTGSSDVRTKVEALRAGADDFCVKPLSLDELEARIRRLLEMRERERRLREETGRFRSLALSDPLTGLGNRRAFEVELGRAWARASRHKHTLALVGVDVDHFKGFNDRYGHRTGDEVLRTLGTTFQKEVRRGDEAFRVGGEEFSVVAPEATHEGAIALAERLRKAIEDAIVIPPLQSSWTGPLHVTASLGLAVVPHGSIPSARALIEAADQALYRAKDAGRNRVAWVDPSPVARWVETDPRPTPC